MFLHMLKDVYYAEKQILKALPKMAKVAKAPELKKAFETHRDKTDGHVARLGQVFEIIGKAPRGKTCDVLAEETKTDKTLTQLGAPANSAAVAKAA
ncbi:YciE/YciF ferroxidase family protein [Bosea sp. TAF32]|uniref:YciE/YciF ferroxidase family protein n=1 Tax=Bosea sp. TAF32 TaxID=3237482 RepID=UPI003F939920